MRHWLRRYREESRGKRGVTNTAAAILESEPAAPAAPDPREVPVEPDPNPKRRFLKKSASSTASGSGQQREKRPIPDNETRVQAEDMSEMGTGDCIALPRALPANTRPRIVVKSEPVAVTTQGAVDGYCEKTMRIASVEQIDLLSITGQVLKRARRSNLSGRLSLRKADGWILKNHSHLTVARHLLEKTHPSTPGKVKNEEYAVQR